MSLENAFHELAVKKAKKQTKVVDYLLEKAPILDGLPMEPSSDGLHNTYEEQTEVTGADMVDLDGVLPEVNSTSQLKQVGLSPIGAKMVVGIDKAKAYGGAQKYFQDKMRPIMKKTGMGIEESIFYNSFRAYAAENTNLIDGGGSGSTNYTMMCVQYSAGEINGLYDPNGFGNGKMFDVIGINGGNVYEDSNGRLVYGVAMKNYLGMQLANPRYVSGIVNCDIVNDDLTGTRTFPTEMMIDDMILNAEGDSASTAIYCHPKVLNYLYNYKGDKLFIVPENRAFNRQIASWNGIPIITTYNVTAGTETRVTSGIIT